MMQEIHDIEISQLHLWTENPRDPVDLTMSDKDIILRAINQKQDKWELEKLISKMGNYYDKSELPTVVKENNNYLVYDGNRRLAIIKYSQNPEWSKEIENKLFPTNIPDNFKNMSHIPCNLCDKDTALNNIERKHIDSGSWGELERSYFLHVHRRRPKNHLLIFEENADHIISNNTNMNKRFIFEEVLTDKNLQEIGFNIESDKLVTNYDEDKTKLILEGIVKLINEKVISTRNNRGELLNPLKKHFPHITFARFDQNKSKNDVSDMKWAKHDNNNQPSNITQRTKDTAPVIFGKKLILKEGIVNDIYRDIVALYEFYEKKKNKLSKFFPGLIRMALRLLVEAASAELSTQKNSKPNTKPYIDNYFDDAKQSLNQDEKTTLSAQNVIKESLMELLNVGAHAYTASQNIAQTLAMSLIIGAMLQISHKR